MARALIFAGVALIVIGIIWQFGGKLLPLGRLPGDLNVAKGNLRIYFPIATSLVISLVLSLILMLIRFLGK